MKELDMEHMELRKSIRKIVSAVLGDIDFYPLWQEAGESIDSLNRSILWSFAKLECSTLNENSIERALYELEKELL